MGQWFGVFPALSEGFGNSLGQGTVVPLPGARMIARAYFGLIRSFLRDWLPALSSTPTE